MKTNHLDYINFEEVNKLLEGFNKSTGFVTAILDLEGKVLSKSGWRQICTGFHRVNPETSGNCRISDTILANESGKEEKYHFYKCLNGLVDVAVPIVINGEHVANLFSGQFFFDEPDRDFFRQQAHRYGFNEHEYLKALADVPVVSREKVTIAMDFLLNMTQLISDITLQKIEQSQLNEALRKSEERSRSALDNMLEGCQIIGHDWRYIYLNHSAGVHNRRPNNELLGRRYQDMWPGIEKTVVFKIISNVLEKRVPNHFENEFVFPSGESGWFDLSIQPVPEGVFILSIDITQRKRNEEQLFESEFRFGKLYENGPFGMVMADSELRFKKANPAFCSILGYNEDELRSLTFIQVTHPDDITSDLSNIRKLTNKEIQVYRTEKRYIRKDGQVIWGSLTVTTASGSNGQFLYYLAVIEDITPRKDAEEELSLLNERISTATRSSQVGIWDWDIKNNILTWDDQMYSLYSLKKEEFTGAYEAWINGLHPADRDFCQNETRLALLGKKEYDTEFRVVWPDGTVHFIKGKGEVFRDERDDPVRMVGINFDITEKKLAEEELQYNEALLIEVGRIANVGGWDFDPSSGMANWTEQVARIHDLDPQSPASVTLSINYYSEHCRPIIEKAFHDLVEYAIPYDLELEIDTAKGNHKWVRTIGRPVVENGKVTRVHGSFQDVTERKMIEIALQESEEIYRKALKTSPDSININRLEDGMYVSINQGFIDIMEYAEADVIGKTSIEISLWHNPEDRQRLVRELNSKGFVANLEAKFCSKSGRLIDGLMSAAIIEISGAAHIISITRDITERKRVETALHESEEKFRMLIENIPLPVTYVTIDGEIIFRNERFLQVIGYPYEEVPTIGEWWVRAYPDDQYREWVSRNWTSLVERASEEGTDIAPEEYEITCKDGLERTFTVSGIIIGGNLLIIFIDITDRKKAEYEIMNLNETLEERVGERTAQLQEANKELEAFSYSVSHDLRSPLRHINGFAEILSKQYSDHLPDDAQKHLNTIMDSAKKMGSLIDDLLSFSRTGRTELKKSTLNMNQVLEDAMTQLKPTFVDRRIDWIIPSLPQVFGDYSLLRLVWVNLLDNAVKYTLIREEAVIQIGYEKGKKEIIFFIKDNGAGFDMKYVQKLFGVFQRLHSPAQFEGTGIGLANVRRIILRHGGRTWAEAKPDEGATFYFSIPKKTEVNQ